MKEQKLTKQQQQFIKKFVDMLYYSMAIEHEAPYSKQEFYKRYKHHAIDLIEDGSYKKVQL